MPDRIDDILKKKGLPEYIPIDKSKYTGNVLQPKPETEAEKYKRTTGMAGMRTPEGNIPVETPVRVVGLPETTPVPKPKVTPTEEYVPAPGGTNKPYGYPEEGKVYTEADLGEPMTGGGFGYVPKGLPEAKVSLEDYYKETITKMQDRADKLVLQIESGFAKGKRLTAAAEELRGIQSTIPLLMEGISKAGVGVRATEAEIGKTEAEKAKLERETIGLPSTFAESKELKESTTKGLAETLYIEYQKGLNKVLAGTYMTPEDRQVAVDAYKAQYPQYNVAGSSGLPGDIGGNIPQEGSERVLTDGSRWRVVNGKYQRWRE